MEGKMERRMDGKRVQEKEREGKKRNLVTFTCTDDDEHLAL